MSQPVPLKEGGGVVGLGMWVGTRKSGGGGWEILNSLFRFSELRFVRQSRPYSTKDERVVIIKKYDYMSIVVCSVAESGHTLKLLRQCCRSGKDSLPYGRFSMS